MPDKVTSGDIIEPRAGLWNDMVDAANAHKRGRLGLARKPRPPKITPPDRVKVKNVSGVSLEAGSVVELGPFLLDELDNNYLWFEADEPSSTTGVHAILRKALPNNEIGEAQLVGTVVALVNVNDENHEYANVEPEEFELQSAETGSIRILHSPGTGSQHCAVLLPKVSEGSAPTEQLGGLVARLESTELDRWSYTGSPRDILGRQYASGYAATHAAEHLRPKMPSARATIYQIAPYAYEESSESSGSSQSSDIDAEYQYTPRETSAVLVNPTPWKYYKETDVLVSSNGAFDEDLLYVRKHGSIYVVDRPVSWTPMAVFTATTISSGFLEWDIASTGPTLSAFPYFNNKLFGDIAEPDDTDTVGGIKIIAPGYRAYEVTVQVQVWLSGITASAVSYVCAINTSKQSNTPFAETISTGNFTSHRTTISLKASIYMKQGDRFLWTSLSLTPSVTPASIHAIMWIRPLAI